jgi:DNA-binding HxlR family transcriptional regulator
LSYSNPVTSHSLLADCANVCFYTKLYSVSTEQLIALFHHRWAAPALAILADRDGVRFAELQRKLGVGRESLRHAVDALLELRLVRRNTGYGHPLRPEYLATASGRSAGRMCARILAAAGERDLLLRKWSVPTLAQLDRPHRFSELHAALPGITPRALALALRDLEAGALVEREVLATRPPSSVYRATRSGRRVRTALKLR